MNCVLCNPALQYLVCKAWEEFAQPSITPPHKQYVITSVPRLCKWLQDSLSCNYFCAKLAAEAEKQVTGKIRALIVLVCNICLYDTLPPPAPPHRERGEKNSWVEQTLNPVPRSDTLHRSTAPWPQQKASLWCLSYWHSTPTVLAVKRSRLSTDSHSLSPFKRNKINQIQLTQDQITSLSPEF